MIKGLYTSVAGLHAADIRQQVLASNLANANTPGYKGDDVTTESFDNIFNELYNPPTPGTGAVSTAELPNGRKIDLTQGALAQTGGPLDLALQGDGFFVLNSTQGPLYTRSGRFSRDANGTLRSPDGLNPLGVDGQPITAPGTVVQVQPDGTVTSDGTVVGRLQVVTLPQGSLLRAGTATFSSTGAPAASQAQVVSGALENSNVDVTAVMTTMTMLLRAFEAGKQAEQIQNESLGETVNQVGSVH